MDIQDPGFVPNAFIEAQSIDLFPVARHLVRQGRWREIEGGFEILDCKQMLEVFEISDKQELGARHCAKVGHHDPDDEGDACYWCFTDLANITDHR